MSVRIDDGVDAGAIWHYGNPVAEQKALVAGVAAVDLSHRDVVEITGPERLTWLHALSAQKIDGLAPDVDVDVAILSPKGHVEHLMRGADDGTAFRAHVEPGRGAALAQYLASMIFATRVEVRLADDFGVAARDGRELLVPRDDVESLLGSDRAGLWAYEALRIERGFPRLWLDTDERTLPNEVDMPGTVVGKGCYRGQEAVAHCYNLGRPPRRLVRLLLDGSVDELPPVGADVVLGDTRVGFVGASSRHYEAGPIALALIKRGTDVDAELSVAGIAASQEVVVDPEVGLHFKADSELRGNVAPGRRLI